MKTAAVLSVVLLTGASIWLGGCSGCGGCHGETPVPSVAPTVVPTTSEAAAAGATAAVVPEQGGEVDCFVIVDADPDFGAPPLTVNFTTETDCTGSPVTFSWDFGDGTKGGNDPKPSHTYQKAGDYIATVTVTAPDGGSGTDEIDLTVDEDLAE
jgi:PKD repeat protein